MRGRRALSGERIGSGPGIDRTGHRVGAAPNRTLSADLSVIMAVYAGVEPVELEQALSSLVDQTLGPHEVVVAEDGPLNPGIDRVLDDYRNRMPLRTVRLPKQSGSGPAKQAALQAASTEWVAVADADDVSLPHRLEEQMVAVTTHRVDLLGTAMEEFDSRSGASLGIRRFPSDHESLVRVLRSRNPINHPTVLMRRTLALRVGGYQNLQMLEDYDLWARMVAAGGLIANHPEVLVRFRGGHAALRRRRTKGLGRAEWMLQRRLHAYGLIGPGRMAWNFTSRMLFRVMPFGLAERAYSVIFLASDRRGADA
jgi:glycosyltransferase involved in cell wall biosynthesis